jgi:hypothetical protein
MIYILTYKKQGRSAEFSLPCFLPADNKCFVVVLNVVRHLLFNLLK